jgi:carbamoyltransferase
MKKILGISAFYHDSAAAISLDGNIVAAAQEERFTREKHSPEFPINAIRYCLKEANCSLNDLDAIVFYDKPLLKFERLLETYYAFAPRGLFSFLKAMPVWLKEKLFLKKLLHEELKEVDSNYKKKKLLFTEHHLSHAASAFYPSPFEKAAVLTIDGVGEWATVSVGIGEGKQLRFLKELHFPHSVGLLYSAFTYFLGFKVNSGEYKLMGLAPYGVPDAPEVEDYIQKIKSHLVEIKTDGSIWLNQDYFKYAVGLKMIYHNKWEKLFGIKKREEKDEIEQAHCNLALAIQAVTEEIVLKLAEEAKRITGAEQLCLAGGVALNCVANGRLIREKIFKDVFIQPASGDAGGALGAALAAYHIYFDGAREVDSSTDSMHGSYLGPAYKEAEVKEMIEKFGAEFDHYESFDELCKQVAKALNEGEIVGWFQGRMEFGPRALGNRSILGDPGFPEMQKRLNLKIKKREGFRPFAPAVLAEDASLFFDMDAPSPYMLTTVPVSKAIRSPLADNYYQLALKERLYANRSKLQAITHLDFSARVQTVSAESNSRFSQLLQAMKQQNGKAVLVNTSFNVRGEPIVLSPEDAYRCFMNTEMDLLVINNFVFTKQEQKDWDNADKWSQKFKKD